MVPIIGPAVAPVAWGVSLLPVLPSSMSSLEFLVVTLEIALGAAALFAVRRINRRAVALYGRSLAGASPEVKRAA
jgi:hypothetical protein